MDKKVIIKRIFLFTIVVLIFINVTKTTSAFPALTEIIPPPPNTQEQHPENTPPPLNYKLLAPLGETTEVSPSQLGSYLQLLINISIGITGAIAVLMLIVGGLEYVLSSVNEAAKTDAKSRITNAIFGLLLVLSGYLILNTINPDLVRLGLPRIAPLPIIPRTFYGISDRRPGEEGLSDEEFRDILDAEAEYRRWLDRNRPPPPKLPDINVH